MPRKSVLPAIKTGDGRTSCSGKPSQPRRPAQLCCSPPSANARITEIRIDAAEPFAEGQSFGAVGAYERMRGVAKGELDPEVARRTP